jgi:hypothetical protein
MPKRCCDILRSLSKICAFINGLEPEATPWQVASCCARILAEALRAHAVVIHQHDGGRREIRSIGVHGPHAGDVLGMTANVDDDIVATAVLANEKPLVLRFDGALPRFLPERHGLLGTSRSLTAFPVVGMAGCVGIIEVVGVAEEWQQGVLDACELVTGRLASALDALHKHEPGASDTTADTGSRGTSGRWFAEPLDVAEQGSSSGCDVRVLPSAGCASPITFPKGAPTLVCRAECG